MKLREFTESEFDYIFDAACVLYVDEKEVVVDEKTEDSVISQYYDREILMICPISLNKEKMLIDYDPIEQSINFSMPLGFGIVLDDAPEEKDVGGSDA